MSQREMGPRVRNAMELQAMELQDMLNGD